MNNVFIQVMIDCREHKRLFNWLDENTTKWSLALGPQGCFYRDLVEWLDIEQPEPMVAFLKKAKWRIKTYVFPVIETSPENGCFIRLFWENSETIDQDETYAHKVGPDRPEECFTNFDQTVIRLQEEHPEWWDHLYPWH